MSENGVLIIGDSRAESFFQQGNTAKIQNQYLFAYGEAMLAATVTGFGRSPKALNVNSRVRKLIEQHQESCQHVVFALGQVDVELGRYYRRVVKDNMIEPEALFGEIIELCISNIKSLSRNLCPIVKGINQTVLRKQPHAFRYISRILFQKGSRGDKRATLKSKLREVYPSYDVRLMLNTTFNQILAEAAAKAGIAYFDINGTIVNKDTGKVEDMFCPSYSDHHVVNSVAMHKIQIQHVLAAIGRSSPDEKTV